MITVQVPRHPKRILFNRVPKCGSSTLMDVMVQMADTHNFTFTRAKEYMRFHLDDFWMLIRRIKTEPTPVIYERHIHYFDSEKYGMERPVFINVIRDPLERMVSWYYFRRYQDGHERQLPIEQRTFDECVLGNHSECMEHGGAKAEEGFFKIIPFFCGQEEFCREPTKEALVQAIKNVKKHYLVVGVLEDFEGFIEVLEFLLPDYFQGAQEVYTKQGRDLKDRHKTTYKLPVSEQTEQIMRARLFKEYQFYMFVQKRFRRMLEAVRAAKLETMTT
ncbi:hypothetical protein CAPTEDRAFT_140021 [Capitella teleta]|uniref:Sulfotransferase domain-containing protein n=1 Tax=Capitella teleta TaxID=283909 RepID=R7VC53_CAPTE|nr:hypothetical protein CAPTEDRAFT_140021 [Capitella teleta]|eukprot:ELU16142.1 hypothetical protein CAPTEDRAFT_140021 [Capitella teleta]